MQDYLYMAHRYCLMNDPWLVYGLSGLAILVFVMYMAFARFLYWAANHRQQLGIFGQNNFFLDLMVVFLLCAAQYGFQAVTIFVGNAFTYYGQLFALLLLVIFMSRLIFSSRQMWGWLASLRTAAEVQAIRQSSEERIGVLERLSGAGYFSQERGSQHLVWSPGMFAIFNYPPEKGTPTLDQLRAMIHPEDRRRLQLNTERMWNTGAAEGVYRYRIVTYDGQERWMRANFGSESVGDRVVRMFGACQLIDENGHTAKAGLPSPDAVPMPK